MGNPTIIQKYILWPISDWLWNKRYNVFTLVLKHHGMDWGKYPIEEISKMYHKYQSEINRE